MTRRKPTINLESEGNLESTPFPVKTTAATSATKVNSNTSALPDNASVERRKPQLNEEQLVVKKLPFALASKPLPQPSPQAFPSPLLQTKPIPQSEYLNVEKPMSDEAKAQQIFATNYVATYGKVSASEIDTAFIDHGQTTRRSKTLSKDADARLKLARTQTQWSTRVHAGLILIEVTLFIALYIARGGLTFYWYKY